MKSPCLISQLFIAARCRIILRDMNRITRAYVSLKFTPFVSSPHMHFSNDLLVQISWQFCILAGPWSQT